MERAMGMNLTIGEDAARIVTKMVDSGQYGTAEEVVEHALVALALNEPFDEAVTAWLRDAWEKGVASGNVGPLDIEAFKAETRCRWDAGE
jgi:antitoxin ParD1/3/4